MKGYFGTAVGAALFLAAGTFSYAQTPPGTDRPKGETSQTSASPKMDKGGMKGATRKASKKPKATKRTQRSGMSGGMTGGMQSKQNSWGDDWFRGWGEQKK